MRRTRALSFAAAIAITAGLAACSDDTDGASPDLKAGDVVEIEITGIGTLRKKFVAEKR